MSEEEQAAEEAQIEREASKMPKDEMHLEVELCAWVRSYYLTAAMRFIENVSLHMNSGLFPTVQESVNLHLEGKLGLLNCASRDVFDSLMEEEKKTAEMRERLKGEHAKYDSAMATIQELERSIGITDLNEDEDASDNIMDLGYEFHGRRHDVGTLTPTSAVSDDRVQRTLFRRQSSIVTLE